MSYQLLKGTFNAGKFQQWPRNSWPINWMERAEKMCTYQMYPLLQPITQIKSKRCENNRNLIFTKCSIDSFWLEIQIQKLDKADNGASQTVTTKQPL